MMHHSSRLISCATACLAAGLAPLCASHVQETPPETTGASSMYESATVTMETEPGRERTFSYRLMRPDPRAAGSTHPLVVFLHGAGERGSDNRKQLTYLPEWMASEEHRKKHPCFLLALQCPEGEFWAPYDREKDMAPIPGPPGDALLAVVRAIDELVVAEAIDLDRIYVTGLSMGGYGTWRLATLQPDRFAAVVPICGGGDPAGVKSLVGQSVWAVHGTSDAVVPERRSLDMVKAIRAAGGDVRYSSLDGVQHDSWTPAYRSLGVIEWMFEKTMSSDETGTKGSEGSTASE